MANFWLFFWHSIRKWRHHNLIITSNRADCSKSLAHACILPLTYSPTDQYFALLFCLWLLFAFKAFNIKTKMRHMYRKMRRCLALPFAISFYWHEKISWNLHRNIFRVQNFYSKCSSSSERRNGIWIMPWNSWTTLVAFTRLGGTVIIAKVLMTHLHWFKRFRHKSPAI